MGWVTLLMQVRVGASRPEGMTETSPPPQAIGEASKTVTQAVTQAPILPPCHTKAETGVTKKQPSRSWCSSDGRSC